MKYEIGGLGDRCSFDDVLGEFATKVYAGGSQYQWDHVPIDEMRNHAWGVTPAEWRVPILAVAASELTIARVTKALENGQAASLASGETRLARGIRVVFPLGPDVAIKPLDSFTPHELFQWLAIWLPTTAVGESDQ